MITPGIATLFQDLSEGEFKGLSDHVEHQRTHLTQVSALVKEATRKISGGLPSLQTFTQQQSKLAQELCQPQTEEQRALLLADLQANDHALAQLFHQLVQGLQCEDLVLQILSGCGKDLDRLEERAKVWDEIHHLEALSPQSLSPWVARVQALNTEPCMHPRPAATSLTLGDVELF